MAKKQTTIPVYEDTLERFNHAKAELSSQKKQILSADETVNQLLNLLTKVGVVV